MSLNAQTLRSHSLRTIIANLGVVHPDFLLRSPPKRDGLGGAAALTFGGFCFGITREAIEHLAGGGGRRRSCRVIDPVYIYRYWQYQSACFDELGIRRKET